MLENLQKYRFACTLTFGDIYGQVIVWLIVIFVGMAASVALYNNPVTAFLVGGLILVLSLPFLLFAFVTTLLNHIELRPISAQAKKAKSAPARAVTSEVAPAN
ncbi:hypothetical protein [Synechococcus sp. PCC 6312]|uniref:hypothetical protein n=1 Tax=Synechococcus sp. (strain ATCC 27167 / PCC 6312) TaxID=195253 RepID=UPI00029F2F22|nr:hypothetical protein [Synechococcus sp. PCC 6312]AFY61649.1 hypothetical protein Syn6312_2550 [Synechococcus sp. PCC 6312]